MAYNNNNNNNKSTTMQSNELLNYYLTMNINNICRVCLEKGPKLMPIFDPIKPPHFSILIMACASVQVNKKFNCRNKLTKFFRCWMAMDYHVTFVKSA